MSINTFNVTSLSKVRLMEPKDVGYQDSIDIIRDELQRTRRSFVKIGWYLKHIKDEEMFKEDGYADVFELAMDKFNISQPTANRFMNICEEFSVNHDSPELDEKFVDFSVSQLFEMLPMAEEKREQITPDMTVKQIREVKEETRKKREPDDGEIRDFRKQSDDQLPGQTSIEKDFPEYLPEPEKAADCQPKLQGAGKEVTEEADLDIELPETQPAMQEVVDGDYREISPKPNQEPCDVRCGRPAQEIPNDVEDVEQTELRPELPILKNNDQRKAWLNDYKAWGLWYYDEHIDVNYYKYDFPDGSRLIVAEYPQREKYWGPIEQADEHYYHLLKKDKKKYGALQTYDEKYRYSANSETEMIEFLKNLQMKGRSERKI